MQGQFTQELRISTGKFCYGLWLNQKGKLLADSYILRLSPDEHLVFAPRTAPAVLVDRLEAYLIADEVEILNCSSSWRAVTLWGEDAAHLVTTLAAGAALDPLGFGFAQLPDAFVWPARQTVAPSYILLIDGAARREWTARLLAAGASEAEWSEVERARIGAGIPAVPDDVGPSDLPNEGGLERDAISFTKGCYLGQEVMSRLKNLGQVRRKLHVVRGSGEPPPRGADLFQGEQRVGEIRSAASDGEGGFVAFAMLSLVTLKPDLPLSRAAGGSAEVLIVHG